MIFLNKNNTQGFTSIAILLLFGTVTAFLMVSFNILQNSLLNVDNYTDKTRAINNSKLWINDGLSYFYNNKNLFYNINNTSPCNTIWSVSNYANYNSNSFILSETLQFKDTGWNKIWNENLKDDQWFINRKCSLYSKWFPNKNVSDFSVKWEGSSISSDYKWQSDENWFYNIWKIFDNNWFGYFFTMDQIWEDEINIKLDYNFEIFKGIDSFNIYNSNIKDKILLLKKNDPTRAITKTNLKDILTDSLYLYSDAHLEIWIIEFDWTFNTIDWFKVNNDSWKILESIHIKWNNIEWLKKWRLLCEWIFKTCELSGIKLKNNKVYFYYLKSFEKPTTYHLEVTDKIWESVFVPTNYLNIETFWFSNWVLFRNNKTVNIWNKWWYFSDFSSIIYNYVFFSKN